MYIFESKNHITHNIDSITAKSVIELSSIVLNYHNGKKEDDKEYFVIFFNKSGEIILEITEESLKYIIFNEEKSVSDKVKDEIEKFISLNYDDVENIEFTNPIRKGDAYWDIDYTEEDDELEGEEEDEEDEDEEDSDLDDDIQSNINQLSIYA